MEVKFYRCELCGNIVAAVQDGGGHPTCCGQAMTLLKPNTADASKEKHVPVVTVEGDKVKVAVGSAAHPMLPEHYIHWVALAAEGRLEFVYLKPGAEPKAEFAAAKAGAVYAYCNLHGLWKADF